MEVCANGRLLLKGFGFCHKGCALGRVPGGFCVLMDGCCKEGCLSTEGCCQEGYTVPMEATSNDCFQEVCCQLPDWCIYGKEGYSFLGDGCVSGWGARGEVCLKRFKLKI